jgi:phage protein D
MADGSATTLHSSRPTLRIDGQEYPLVSANINLMLMRERAGGLSSLEVQVTDWLSPPGGPAGYGATSGSPLKLGAKIKVYSGPDSNPQEIFDGMVTAIEGEVGPDAPPSFTVLAEDGLWKARRSRKSATFESMSPADVVKKVAQANGLTPQVGDGLDQPVRTWTQMNESDLAFLRRVLEGIDADLQVVDQNLQVVPFARDKRTSVDLKYGDTLIRARVTADLAEQATEVRVGSFDPASGQAVVGTASDGEYGPGQGRKGQELLQQALGTVREHVGARQPMAQGEADKLAKAIFGRRARKFLHVDATAQGDANIRVGSWVNLSGINPFFANQFVVTEAVHRFDQASGYVTEFQAEGAFLGEPQ